MHTDIEKISSKEWRIDHLYRVVDKHGVSVPFVLNDVQRDVLKNLHSRNLILKARQLGMSTFSVLYILDEAIFNSNKFCGIVSYSLEHAQHIFKKIIGHALDNLTPTAMAFAHVTQHSAREIGFANGSYIRVDTTLRGSSYQVILVSEFGKTCARNPLKAEEVLTGTIQTVPQTGRIIIESTGEGNTGYYADMINQAVQHKNEALSELDYKLFFYPWYVDTDYQTDKKVSYDVELTDYFDNLEKQNDITLTTKQRCWYALQRNVLGDKLKQEYPSTVAEAFASSSEAYYFQSAIEKAYQDKRVSDIQIYDSVFPVHVAMDIGVNDLTVMVFFQIVHGQILIIDYYENNNQGVEHYAKYLLQDRPYLLQTIFLPHDSVKRDGIVVENTYEREFKRYFVHTQTKFVVLRQTDKQINISNAKIKVERCVFALKRTKALLEHLQKYRKKWSEQYGKYLDIPLHDVHCFVGDTLVSTEKGYKKIKDVQIGESVLTPWGCKKVTNKFKHKTRALVEISTIRGVIICTPHHKIFSNKGLITADSLCYDSYLITKEMKVCNISHGKEKNLGYKDYFLSLTTKTICCLMDLPIGKTIKDIGSEGELGKQEVNICKEPFGFTTMGKFLKKCTYTILMKINQIMKFKTSNLFPLQITQSYTLLKKKEIFSINYGLKRWNWLKNGTIQKKVKNGILNTVKDVLKKGLCLKRYVKFAGVNSNLNGKEVLYVRTHAEQKKEEIQEKTMNNECAKSVQESLHATNIQNKNYVLPNAPIKLDGTIDSNRINSKFVRNAEKSLIEDDIQQYARVLKVVELNLDTEIEVYDLEIEEDHCYFANNFLVSNSHYADAFQYAMQGVSQLEKAQLTPDYMEQHRQVKFQRRLKI